MGEGQDSVQWFSQGRISSEAVRRGVVGEWRATMQAALEATVCEARSCGLAEVQGPAVSAGLAVTQGDGLAVTRAVQASA